jgi:ketosteroid isomerase-like protein
MGETSNAAVALRLWNATSRADADAIRELLAPDVEWSTVSSGILSGSIIGAEAVVDMLAQVGEAVDSLTSDLIDIAGSANGAMVHYRVKAERALKHMDTHVQLILRIRAGRIERASAVPFDTAGASEFWSAG